MTKKNATLLICLGIILSTIVSLNYYHKYQEQDSWIRVDASLVRIDNTKPYAQGGKNPDGYQYYGIYEDFNKMFQLQSPPVSQESLINNKETFYVNPDNHNDYHLAYSKYSFLRGLACLIISIIGIVAFCINNSNNT